MGKLEGLEEHEDGPKSWSRFGTGAGNTGNLSSSNPRGTRTSASGIASRLISDGTAACKWGWASF